MATSSNPSVEMGIFDDLEIRQNEIIESHWENEKGQRIKTASLGDTVYFCMKTKRFENGHKLKLQLRGTKGHKTEPLNVEIQNNAAKVKLYIDPKLSTKTDPEISDLIELYWEAHYEKKASLGVDLFWLGSDDIGKYLEVPFVKNRLFIKPSPTDKDFPEVYTTNGEQMVVVQCIQEEVKEKTSQQSASTTEKEDKSYTFLKDQTKDYAKEKARDASAKVVEKVTMRYAMVKMAKGYMVDNMGKVYPPRRGGAVGRPTFIKTVSTNDGVVLKTVRGRDFTWLSPDGKRTTQGVSQIDHWMAKGMAVKGLIEKVGPIFDVFSVTQFSLDPTHSENFPIFFPSASVGFAVTAIGIIGMMELDKVYNDEMYDEYLQKRLDDAKRESLEAVQKLLEESGFKQAGYNLIYTSKKIASDIVSGKYKDIYDVEEESRYLSSKDITILYKKTIDPSNDPIAIIETFFEKE